MTTQENKPNREAPTEEEIEAGRVDEPNPDQTELEPDKPSTDNDDNDDNDAGQENT